VKVVFAGTPPVAVDSLEALVRGGHEVTGVLTRPDRPRGRSGRPLPPAVKRSAVEHGFDVLQPRSLRSETLLQALREAAPDVLVVVAYGRILPPGLLDLAPLGAVNVHFSLLPKYRGAAPVSWALAHGESVTGVTTMQISERLDEGDVLLQEEVAIEDGEHAPALERRLAALGAELLLRTLDGLRRGALKPRPQDHARASLAPLLTADDGRIDPARPAREIEGRIRGFDPWPGAWVARAGRRIRLVEGRGMDREVRDVAPGTVIGAEGDGVLVACGGGSLLRVDRLQPEGRNVMLGRDAVNGRQIRPGDRLERPAAAA
jgi:methionyl-tRNA formyltransferase